VQSVECGKAQTDISSLTTSTIYLIQRYNTNINFPAIFHLDLSEMSHLHKAFDSKSWEEALNLINQGADVHAADESGLTPLHYAVLAYPRLRSGFHIDDHEYSSAIDILDRAGRTALHHAAQICEEETIRLLLEKGADIKATDNNDQTALHYTAVACEVGPTGLLIEKGADIKAADNDGQTALHQALSYQLDDFEETVKLPVENGADTKARCRYQGSR
jgi:ankyrin repeat protein